MPGFTVDSAATRTRLRRARWAAGGILSLLVFWRAAVFLIWPEAYFDSDQAVFGLMAKHVSEGRAFPVFMYGQSYILAVEAWLAAPLFLLVGASAALLKLPLLVLNLAVVLLLLRLLERDVGLHPAAAAIPVLFFALPPPGTARYFMDPSGGNIEPFLYVLLIWMTRHRPNACGLILGVGFLHREFTIYGLAAILIIELADGTLLGRAGIVRRLQMLRTAAEIWIVVQFLSRFATAAGPGTSVNDLGSAPNNLYELVNRTCIDPGTLGGGAVRLITFHWPNLFGAYPASLGDFSIESASWQGLPGAWLLVAAAAGVALITVLAGLVTRRAWRAEHRFCFYLVLVGAFSAGGYVAGRCGQVEIMTMRYDLMSILGLVGLGALCLCIGQQWIRAAWVLLAIASACVAALGHARLTYEYAHDRPVGAKELLVRHVKTRGIQYGYADYWTAYYVSFMTGEQVVLASSDFVRIRTYQTIVDAHREQAVRIARQPCEGGRALTPSFYLCPP